MIFILVPPVLQCLADAHEQPKCRLTTPYVMASFPKSIVQVVDLPEFTVVAALLVKRHITCHNRVNLCENHGQKKKKKKKKK